MNGHGDGSRKVWEMVERVGPLPGAEEEKESEDVRAFGRECFLMSGWSEFGASQGQALSSYCPGCNALFNCPLPSLGQGHPHPFVVP